MADRKLDPLLLYIRKLTEAEWNSHLSDRELLRSFAADRDQAAFTALVRRYGDLVLRICRRVLHSSQDAEDVFQATFMVLSRKAGSRQWQATIGKWLCKVTYHLALEARAIAARRHTREVQAAQTRPVMDARSATALQEIEAVLDEELKRLPEKLRFPMILCCLEGQTWGQAAQHLGCSETTIGRRISQARELLRSRLASRGIALSTALLAAELTTGIAPAALPVLLVAPTVRAAVAFATYQRGLQTGISTQAAAWAEGALQAMLITKVKLGAVLVAATLMVGTVSALVSQRSASSVSGKDSLVAQPTPRTNLAPIGQKKGVVDTHGDTLPEGVLARMGTARWRHGGSISHVEYLPDGKRALTVGQDRRACLWDIATGQPLHQFRVASASAFNFALSTDGNLLAMSGKEPVIYLYEVNTGKELHKLQIAKSNSNFSALIFTPDGRGLVAATSTSTIHVWDTATGKELRQLGGKPFRPGINSAVASDAFAFADDGKTLLWAGGIQEGQGAEITDVIIIRMWDFATGEERHQHKIFTGRLVRRPLLAFSPGGKLLAWASYGQSNIIHLFHVVTGHEIREIKIGDGDFYPNALAFTSQGKLLAVRDTKYQKVSVWDVATGQQRCQIEAPTKARKIWLSSELPEPSSVAFSVDCKTLAVGGNSSVRFLNMTKGTEVDSVGGHHAPVSLVRFSLDSKTLLSQSEDESVREWDAKTGKEIRQIKSMAGKRIPPVYSRDGRIAAAIVGCEHDWAAAKRGGDLVTTARLRVWDTVTDKDIRIISVNIGDNPSFLALSSNGRWLAMHRKFYAQDGPKRQLGQLHETWLYDLFTDIKDPKYIFECENVADPQRYTHRPAGIMFSADNQLLAVPFNEHMLNLWDVVTGKRRGQIEVSGKRSIRSMAFAPDGKSVALELDDGSLSIWDVATGKKRCRMNKRPRPAATQKLPNLFLYPFFFRPNPTVTKLAFSPDSEVLVEGRMDGTIGVWEAATGEEIGILRGHKGPVQAVAFAPDGKTLASGSMDTTVLLWDMKRWTQRKKLLQRNLSDRDLESQWKTLASPDQAKAYQAVLALASDPSRAVPFLRKHLRPVAALDAARVQRLIRDLDSDKYVVRMKASRTLEQDGEASVPLLRQALKDKTLSAETHKRLRDLLTKLAQWPVTGERLRQLWAVEALEMMGTSEAKQVLQTLARGVPDVALTRAAQAALKRLGR